MPNFFLLSVVKKGNSKKDRVAHENISMSYGQFQSLLPGEGEVFMRPVLKSRYSKLFVLDKNDKTHTIEILERDVSSGTNSLKDSVHVRMVR